MLLFVLVKRFFAKQTSCQVPAPAWFKTIRRAIADETRHGVPRSADEAFRIRIVAGHGHFDVLLADNASPGGNGVFDEILAFVFENARGEVLVP